MEHPPENNSRTESPATRCCAIYTRISVEDRDDPTFSSILAQEEACEAFIASQKHERWLAAEFTYEDAGYSGRDLNRPALQRLLQDIERGQIQIVVVHRLDRLSRRLVDFTLLNSLFEQYGVALVSVTQQINSDTPLGRLMLNTLMTFAEFERDIIGDRIRDKIAASRSKGLWQGAPPFGYDVLNKQLLINETEAATVRHIFQRFLDEGSASALVMELNANGITTKHWKTASGKVYGGRSIDKIYLYKLLRNRMYVGEVRYAGQWHPGKHETIITRELWNEVNALISYRTRPAPSVSSEPFEFLLRGRVFGTDGRAYSPWRSSRRKNRVYRYYIPQKEIAVGAGASGLPRHSAYELESQVVECLRETLRNPSRLIEGLPPALKSQSYYNEANVVMALTSLDARWPTLEPLLQKKITLQLVQRVIVGTDELELRIDADGIMQCVSDFHQASANCSPEVPRPSKKRNSGGDFWR